MKLKSDTEHFKIKNAFFSDDWLPDRKPHHLKEQVKFSVEQLYTK